MLEIKLIDFFKKIKVFRTEPLCKKCNIEMAWRPKSDAIDKFTWKCNKSKCGTTQSIRTDTFLSKCDKHMHVFIKLLYHWAVKTPIETVQAELGVSHHTVITYFQRFRTIAVKELNKSFVVLGGNRTWQ
jgi:hypothetical protein